MNNKVEFSDSENEEDEIMEESDDSLDEETRRIIYEHVNKHSNDYDMFVKKEEVTKVRKEKKQKNKSLNIGQLLKQMEGEKPKKFISRRAEDKKKGLGIALDIIRKFNPRLPPYNVAFSEHRRNREQKPVFSMADFPSL
jgi:predicted ribonuclease toxin of YeeF-YezG toxin-antitoxin module